jgi:excisionase family DNA binding protein
MQIELPDSVIDVLREALTPVLDRLITERSEQRRPMLLSVTEVADELSCSRASVFGLIHGGDLEAIRIGRTYRVATATPGPREELTKSRYERSVVTAPRSPRRAPRSTGRADAARYRVPPTTSIVPATKPPRPPRQKKQKGPSKQEITDSRCTVAESAERWWGPESATALIERSGVVLSPSPDGEPSFRYGDLVEWMERNGDQFEEWTNEFDPVLKRAPSSGDNAAK